MKTVYINLVTYCLVFVAKALLILLNHGFDTLSNCEGCLIRPSEAKPHPYLTASWR